MADNGRKPLRLWAVYKYPTDYPESYVARLFENDVPTGSVIVCEHYEVIEQQMQRLGLYRLVRAEIDEPHILETWI